LGEGTKLSNSNFILAYCINLLLGQALTTKEAGRNLVVDHPKALEDRYITLVDMMGQVRDYMTMG
jgi:hypothetical protein